MVMCWGVAIPLAIMAARFYKVTPKQRWPEELDNKLWWNVHRLLNYSSVLGGMVAVALVFKQDSYASAQRDAHALMGWTVLVFGLLQVAGGHMRGTKSKQEPRARRVHDAHLKSKVLAECSQAGASVSAVALAHGLNANLVHKWRRGVGLQRAALNADLPARAALASAAPASQAMPVQFVPVGMPMASEPTKTQAPSRQAAAVVPVDGAMLQVELRRGANSVTVRWPTSQTTQCTQWLRELTGVVFGTDARAP
jgi:transposase-like protein